MNEHEIEKLFHLLVDRAESYLHRRCGASAAYHLRGLITEIVDHAKVTPSSSIGPQLLSAWKAMPDELRTLCLNALKEYRSEQQ